jgi:anhydro-N-acetylmuramic acid kinase
MTAYDFCKFDRLLGTWIGEQAANFIAQNDISRVPYQCNEEIDIVGSHGHTVFHDPVEKMTVQVGHPACIAARIKQSVVADFRSIDVALGGT